MKITKQIEHFNLDHDVVIAVQNGTEVEILMRILKDVRCVFAHSTPERMEKSLKD